MKVLFVYPEYPDSYWSFRHALRFISKKAAVPPLGLITVSAMLPEQWEKKLIDMNVTRLQTSDIVWADYVFISAMYIQKESVSRVIEACRLHDTKIVAGGPLFTQEYENYPQIDHFVLNEAEITMPLFLRDLDQGKLPERIYQTGQYADLKASVIPDYHLLERKKYAFMNLQVSRGCPFACDFCEITALLGRKVRMKSTQQIMDELDRLYSLKWRGPVFIVDDNFIGNKKIVKKELLPAMITWMEKHKYPFSFNIQSSINLADDAELMTMLNKAGFNSAFIGIETPDEESLRSCNKVQNMNKNILQSVKEIQKSGIQVSAGFIVGFDNDSPSIFQRQIDFIRQSGIVSAMVGLLNAPKNTRLYERLKSENRLTIEASGNNTDSSMNFVPKMDYNELIEGYNGIIQNVYGIEPYYRRIRQFLRKYRKQDHANQRIDLNRIIAFFKTIVLLGIIHKGRREYWKFLIWTLIHRPGSFMDAITFAVYGYHYRTVYGLRDKY